jgi:hypothetical protein
MKEKTTMAKFTNAMYFRKGYVVFKDKVDGDCVTTLIRPDGSFDVGYTDKKMQTACAWTNRQVDELPTLPLKSPTPDQVATLKSFGWSGKQVHA